MDLSLGGWLNPVLLKSPWNWSVVWIAASLWLLAFHVIMQGYLGMTQGGGQAAFSGPGQIAAPVAGTGTANFSTAGLLGGVASDDMAAFLSGGLTGLSPWTDGIESKYAEDGWAAN